MMFTYHECVVGIMIGKLSVNADLDVNRSTTLESRTGQDIGTHYSESTSMLLRICFTPSISETATWASCL
jgi:hypothetical protein